MSQQQDAGRTWSESGPVEKVGELRNGRVSPVGVDFGGRSDLPKRAIRASPLAILYYFPLSIIFSLWTTSSRS